METKNKFLVVLRVFIGVVVWYLVSKAYGYFVAPLIDPHIPSFLGAVISQMIVPYTLGLGEFYLIVKSMPKVDLIPTGNKVNLGKAFVIQSGLGFLPFFILNFIFTMLGLSAGGMTTEEISSNLVYYVILLLVFNPVFEEFLFRRLILPRVRVLGDTAAIFISAALFAFPHFFSVGFPTFVYTFIQGLVWSYVTVKTGKLWPAILLHSMANLYGSFFALYMTSKPITSVLFMLIAVIVMPIIAIVLTVKTFSKTKTAA